ncbi:RNA dependent RNA polymerase-domain-containing protein [Mycena albidolilacea]|uniref:RNA-dependent RNA polymerase n=1 Tax=Mycena albidolilacea TaxID=1033008 RepID=A0AAD7AGI7_9AGAR|nr:RNA dependent RNA polymerase-domain-containing protein [Mycena albidolilacea]
MEYDFDAQLDALIPPGGHASMPRRSAERKPREPPAFDIRPHFFSMGSSQGPIFRQEFRVEVDHAMVKLNLDEQNLFFKIPFNDAPFRLPILQATCSIDDLESVRLIKGPLRTATLTVTLRRPPRIDADFRRMPNAKGQGIRRATELDWSPYGIKEGQVSDAPATTPRECWVPTPMKFGLWLTYRFEFTYVPSDLKRVTVALSRLRTLDRPGTEKIAVDPEAKPDLISSNSSNRNPYVGTDSYNVDKLLAEARYPFEARYLVAGLVSQGLVLPIEVSDMIHKLWPEPPSTRLAVLRALFRVERRTLVGSLAQAEIRKLVHQMQGSRAREPSLTPDRVYMRRAVVTPTRVLLFPEAIETSNRVLRAWPAEMNAGRFIRVGFADEDGRLDINRRVTAAVRVDPHSGILARIHNVLRNGVYIAGRHYVFLAAGESQLKDRSCWMVCEVGDFTADRVREEMGDFSEEHVVAKYAARMGQCFSATKHAVDLLETDIEGLHDIQHDKYVYTDGVGNCSQELATMCAETLGSDQKLPSAVQIRMGGIKGILSVHPDLEGNQVCIRPSMEKFQSPLRGLGVMKVSRFAPAHLNRQAICIMEALGMNTLELLAKYKQQIRHVENLELELQTLDKSRHPAKHVYKKAFIPVTTMIKAGLVDQRLLQNVLKCIKCQLLRDLKYKARVLVPDGAYLMGIADEHDILEEGQIYCAITPTGTSSRRVITGQCTIFRSPSIHPGDVRLVTAIDHPGFQELSLANVVVFSTKNSPRDLPSKFSRRLGGGDLDGDFYTVLYDKWLQITRVHKPMDYSPVRPVPKDNITIDDVCDFAVDFFEKDVVGVVANAHLALADRHGPDHPSCLELAQLHSNAVDFAKSGVAVVIPQRLRPERFPDFMDREPDRSYPSPRVLGKMYRLIEPAPEYQPSFNICIDKRITSKIVSLRYLQAAGMIKQNYDIDLELIMRRYSLCEAELIAGVSITSDRKRQRAADDANRGPVREAMEDLSYRYRREGRRFVKANPTPNGLENWGIACYQITHVEKHRSRWVDSLNHSRQGSAAVSDDGTDDREYSEVTRRELISFPWLWAHEICRSITVGVIKEEEEEDEDLGWRRREDQDVTEEEEEEKDEE